MHTPTTVVVGGGVGGLVAGGLIARRSDSRKVILLEQGHQIGGRLQSQTSPAGARFDTGPSLLLFPDTYRDTFKQLGSALEDHVDVRRIGPAAYRVFYEEGPIDMLSDVDDMADQCERIESGAGIAYREWLSTARAALSLGFGNFIENDITGPRDVLNLAKLIPKLSEVSPVELLGPHAWLLSRRFKDPRLQSLFSFQDLYVGLTPYSAPGVFSLLAATELTDGVWYPMGGFGQVRDGLLAAAVAAGLQVHTDSSVRSVDVAGGRVRGVTLRDGEHHAADQVIINRDVAGAYGLLRDEAGPTAHGIARQASVSGKEYSAGVIAYYWSLDVQLPGLSHHNVFMSEDYRDSWERATSGEELCWHPNFYVHAPSRTDPTAAPAGGDSIMVLLPVANMQELPGSARSSYAELIDAGRTAVLRALADRGVGDGVGQHIVHESVRAPPHWAEMYGLEHGAAFGLSHGLNQLSVFRPAIDDPEVDGLFFTGASTRPGNGVPLCMISGRLAAERAMASRARAR